jgi:glucokinase
MKEQLVNNMTALGVDIGGSHITAGLVDLVGKTIVKDSVIRKRVDSHASAEEILSSWADAINEIKKFGPSAFAQMGIAMPGPFDYEGGVCHIKGFDKYESLYGINIRNELSLRTDLMPETIIFRNDADAFLEGEMFCGAGKGFNKAIGLTLGTGLGSCAFNNGEMSDAGLNVMPFKDGRAEDYISSRWFEKVFMERTGQKINGVKRLADRFYEDEIVRLVFDEFSQNLAEVLVICYRKFEPETIIMGGNIANAYHLFSKKVENLVSIEAGSIIIQKTALGEEAALIGAAISVEKKLVFTQPDY